MEKYGWTYSNECYLAYRLSNSIASHNFYEKPRPMASSSLEEPKNAKVLRSIQPRYSKYNASGDDT